MKEVLKANSLAESKIAAAHYDFGAKSILLPDLVAYIRVRRTPPQNKRIAPAPKMKKAELVKEAAGLYSDSVDVQVEAGEPPDGYEARQENLARAEAAETGWLNQAKGLKQFLFERGWWHSSGTQTLDGVKDENGVVTGWDMELDLGGGSKKTVFVSSSLRECARCLSDFENEVTQLEQLIMDLGHFMDKAPKCHPEIAGARRTKIDNFRVEDTISLN